MTTISAIIQALFFGLASVVFEPVRLSNECRQVRNVDAVLGLVSSYVEQGAVE